ncbi:MAG: glucoamylase family protein [Phycisphaeraceae bacterium]
MDVPAISTGLKRLLRWRRTNDEEGNRDGTDPDAPLLRAKLYSVDWLQRHAKTLAGQFRIAAGHPSDKLLPRLNENAKVLNDAYELVTAAVAKHRRISPAAEWLLDNYYLIEQQIVTAKKHLPRSYSQSLPRLANSPAAGFPRTYGIALEYISHVDAHVDAVSLNGFISAYQTVEPLALGELWAIPIMLRLALLENLRRVAARIASARRDRDSALDWAQQMLAAVEHNPTDLIIVLADMARADPKLTGPFMADLTRQMQGQSPHLSFAISWLEHRLSEQGLTIEQLVRADGQAQAADQISIGNSISSLRFLDATDWRDFVEDQSVVEKTLRDDPARVYGDMDFGTRDRYRHVVEQIAKRAKLSEAEVARKAIELARVGASEDALGRAAHVGYYLIDRGRPVLERQAKVSRTPRTWITQFARAHPLFLYMSGILLLTVATSLAFIQWLGNLEAPSLAIGLIALPAVLCASQLAVSIVNWLAMIWVLPRPLPRMDFKRGVPETSRTIVVIPTMLSSAAGVESLLESLEVRYLANRDPHLHFALLTDFVDAPQENMPGDEHLIQQACAGIEALRDKYEGDRADIFFLFHRPRKWNPQSDVWIGYERKRGKLSDLNALLREVPGASNHFTHVVGELSALKGVRYVITLDTDTQLPRDSARKMIGAMAHPLNRPILDQRQRRVISGYGILQPRVGVSLPSSQRSWYVRLMTGDSGVDPYTRVVSDLYQDVFGEGSFIGKGIYDIDAFMATCETFAPNTILSHDLIESAYARSALLSDVELVEDHPSHYPGDMSRRHRWVRGDWQIAHWLLPWVPGADGRRSHNPVSSLAWWKIFDNLRRSVMAPAMFVLLMLAMLMPTPALALAGVLFVLTSLLAAPLLTAGFDLTRKPSDRPWWTHCHSVARSLAKQMVVAALNIMLLPYEAIRHLDAIARTCVRMCWTRKNLLEWRTASEGERGLPMTLGAFIATMWPGPVAAVLLTGWIVWMHPPILAIIWPLLAMWFIAPLVAWNISRPLAPRAAKLSDKQLAFLGGVGRRTWRFFEQFVTAGENWLPPDNVREEPDLVASRTSPTNIGMALLSNLAACDFGYCPVAVLLERTRNTFDTLARLERYRGHFYNWYDTRTLQPLPPRYVSMVDSGNLAGHLLVLRQGLLELIDAPIVSPRIFDGLRDTARVALDAARGIHRANEEDGGSPVPVTVVRQIEELAAGLTSQPPSLRVLVDRLVEVETAATALMSSIHGDEELQWWIGALEREARAQREDILHLAPWLVLPTPPTELTELQAKLEKIESQSSLRELAGLRESLVAFLDHPSASALPRPVSDDSSDRMNITRLREALIESALRADKRIKAVKQLADECGSLADMDFTFAYDTTREQFAIGYNVDEQRMDASFYDLLASEARLTSFIGIAQGQFGQENWFSLGRAITVIHGHRALLSWTGSMFEYLMPLLVMPNYENTLLDQTYKAVIGRQMKYGKQHGVPWGISESGYNATDQNLNYQYRAFGVPGLGLKRGLAENLVVSPYASALALMIEPNLACRNLEQLSRVGLQGRFGFYEAIDYTPSRFPPGATSAIVRQFMAHHQGMSLLALGYVMLDQPMQRRFEADAEFRAALLLLQERVPKAIAAVYPHAAETTAVRISSAASEGTMRVIKDPAGNAPEVQLLSNGQYHVVVTGAGGGYSRWRDLAVTRWREDPTRDNHGSFCYLRDLDSGEFWSTALHPTLKPDKSYEAIFTHVRAEFRRRDHDILTHTEISVSPEDDIELRRVTITNRSLTPRTIEITSYMEVVLATPAQDLSHPAFSNLFVQTELVKARQAVLCTRRPRSAGEQPPWMMHLMAVRGETVGETTYETDRNRFIGRGRTLVKPAAMDRGAKLTNSNGSVLDPVVAIRRAVRLAPGETVRVDMVTGMAETREAVISLMDKYHDRSLADRVLELAWTHSQIMLQQLDATEADAQVYNRLAGSLIYATSVRRAQTSVLSLNRRGQSGLWGYGISGDLPIALLRIRNSNRIELVRQVLQAHAYWRLKGLSVDLVIWNEDDSIYQQSLQDSIMGIVAASPEAAMVDKPGGVFVRRGELIAPEDRTLLQTVARLVLLDEAGTLSEQAERRGRRDVMIPNLKPSARTAPPESPLPKPERDLAFHNGLGGFTQDGREYVAILGPGQNTPAPWVNVIANPHFGTLVSESGSSYTWSENSHEFRLTPWHNDVVSDVSGEAVYIRDEENGNFWSPSPQPARGRNPYVARHGFGYSVFEYTQDGIVSEMSHFVATDAPVKFIRLKLTNRSGRPRRMSVTACFDWVLGEMRSKALLHVVTEVDSASGAMFTRNPYNPDFGDRVVFAGCSESECTITADRTEFLGRNGSPANPAAMRRVRLSGRVGAGLDPCSAMQTHVPLHDGEEREIIFIVGSAHNEEQARHLVHRFRSVPNAFQVLKDVWHYWSQTLSTVYVETPDASLNFLANGWLLYQTLACRMWARTGFYQSGGAFGFRDQLQDAMALLHAEPGLQREHLLRAAARQFKEGDVQHWWHPPVGRGVRTHFSDDFLWLPCAVSRYVTATGDTGVLQESVPFLTSRPLRPDEESNYGLANVSDEVGTLYEHCIRAIDHALRFGEHGLPLMGCGDWNDGMNLVGAEGKGESVWLAWFMIDVMKQFAALARRQGDIAVADRYMDEASQLRDRIEATAWDGQWYRRAYTDDGAPLGSATSPECQIDSISQSWAVLSGEGDPERSVAAMDSVDRLLVRRDTRLIQLLDPPFDQSDLNPGYIKGYVPGVRENGGQYTHAAIWTVMAFAQMGDVKRAWELFDLINPVKHGNSAKTIATYRVEPYVVAADVYAVSPHVGRGGWTWYTGSASWMYRLITESLLGLELRVDRLFFSPRIPSDWTSYTIHYRYRTTLYHITIRNNGGLNVRSVTVDGADQPDKSVPLVDDHVHHQVVVELAAPNQPSNDEQVLAPLS